MKNSEDARYRGKCLCGAIQYEVDEIECEMAHCHCSMCRLQTTEQYGNFAGIVGLV
jgi:hypothetical protein